jgi:hypothetical protein
MRPRSVQDMCGGSQQLLRHVRAAGHTGLTSGRCGAREDVGQPKVCEHDPQWVQRVHEHIGGPQVPMRGAEVVQMNEPRQCLHPDLEDLPQGETTLPAQVKQQKQCTSSV